jgi:uncharacterized membrane protein
METRIRTVAKTISWRIVATAITSAVVWQVTGKPELGLSIASLDCLIKLFGYYLHERAWNIVKFGFLPALAQTSALEQPIAKTSTPC